MKTIRYIPHPEDLAIAQIELDGKFDELKVIFDEGLDGNPYIIQVGDRLTIEDSYVSLYAGFVRNKEKK